MPLNLSDLEAWAIGEALRQAHGNKSMAAQMLGIDRGTRSIASCTTSASASHCPILRHEAKPLTVIGFATGCPKF